MTSRLAATVVAVSAAVMVGCHWPAGPDVHVHEHQVIELGAATMARVDIAMSAGELQVTSGAAKLFEGDFSYNVPSLQPKITYAVDAGTGVLKVSQQSVSGSYENQWRLSLDETTPLDLHVNLGAGDGELVLGRINLRSLDVRLGAGDLTLDLRGMPAKSYSVKVEAGAGDTMIQLPASVGIAASTSGLIGDVSVSGLEKRGEQWINPRAVTSPVTVDVQVKHAIGDLRISAE